MGLSLDEAVKKTVEAATAAMEKQLNQPIKVTKVHVLLSLEYNAPETDAADSTSTMPCCDIQQLGTPEQTVLSIGVKPREIKSPPKV